MPAWLPLHLEQTPNLNHGLVQFPPITPHCILHRSSRVHALHLHRPFFSPSNTTKSWLPWTLQLMFMLRPAGWVGISRSRVRCLRRDSNKQCDWPLEQGVWSIQSPNWKELACLAITESSVRPETQGLVKVLPPYRSGGMDYIRATSSPWGSTGCGASSYIRYAVAKRKTPFFSFIALIPIYNYIYLVVCFFVYFLSPSLSYKSKAAGTMSDLSNVYPVPRSVPGT